MTERILITGGTGFAGSHLTEALLASGETDVHVTSYGPADEYTAQLLPTDHIHTLDLTNFEATKLLLQKLQPTQIYHLAAFAITGESFDKAYQLLNNNISLQLSVLLALVEVLPKSRLLIVGSAEEYGLSEPGELPIDEQHPLRPINPYGVSKVTQDLLAFAYGVSYKLDLVRVRPFNHIGERQSAGLAVSAFTSQVSKIERGEQEVLKVGNLAAVRDITDVKDMVQAYMIVMEKGVSREVYNIGSGRGIAMSEVVHKLVALAKVPVRVEVDPQRLRPLDIAEIVADNDKIEALGWKATIPLDTTLQRMLDWYRAHP